MSLDPQRLAADPHLSAFVSANAGSGKTKTLIDRVARLLLDGARPETILCVTYTKAAAAEMQRRLFDLLGGWSVKPDTELRKALAELEGRPAEDFDAKRLSDARALFARALETPGGLKIQTIHAFCEKLLRRFPLEAKISPGFQVMEDQVATQIADQARREVALHALKGTGAISEAYARLSVALDFESFGKMFATFEARRGVLQSYFEAKGGLEGAIADVWTVCQFNAPARPEDIAREAMTDLSSPLLLEIATALEKGTDTEKVRAGVFRKAAERPEDHFEDLMSALFTEKGEGDAAKWPEKSKAMGADPTTQVRLYGLQASLEGTRERMRAATIAMETTDALVLAAAYLTAYRMAKDLNGALDFSDLIEKTADLVASGPMAAWVLYKLDGGIDHILLDEAQDTAPDQWRVLDSIVEEFFSGVSVERPRARNLFVVGDEKQSIYSFQGADPALLRQKFEYHHSRATAAGQRFERVDLLESWRSTEDVLGFVDLVFADPRTLDGVPPPAGQERVQHTARREGHRGCVDIWDLFADEKPPEREAWTKPLDEESEGSALRQLARAIAAEIKATVERGDQVFVREPGNREGVWRAAGFGDFLILVRKRSGIFGEVLRALKQAGIPVAGADRLALSRHIIFDDLLALARFCRFPDDDLTLAALLRSPFCDLTDEALFDLAHGRKLSLWTALQDRTGERADWDLAHGFLVAILGLAKDQRPFEFYGRLLGQDDLKRRLLTRLGSEAEEALDEFMNQVLSAEARGVCDLESLAAEFANLEIEVKREMDAVRDEVRVMTAHGAKGLEAPIVFLPETTTSGPSRASPLVETEAGGVLWAPSKGKDCQASAAARGLRTKAEEDEAWRLLYVALTRARDRLILCGRKPGNRTIENVEQSGWWGLMTAAFGHETIQSACRSVTRGEESFRRLGPDPVTGPPGASRTSTPTVLPAWLGEPAELEHQPRFASPSQTGEQAERPATSPLAMTSGLGRYRRGELIHRLLQALPDVAPEIWDAAALRLLGREADLNDDQRREMVEAALGVLRDDQFAEVFALGSRPEVSLVGTSPRLPQGVNYSGKVDRLLVLPDRVLVVDFKSNRPAPARVEDTDPAYLRQMAIYAEILGEIFPGRRIEAALVWTDGPRLMRLPENLLARTVASLTGGH
jgi:ATP-dependent helicase/nuclease subunit A